jgi:hydrogenase maturation protease
MISGCRPGTVARFDAVAGPLPGGTRLVSTHALGAQAALELARALDALPDRLIVIGVEGVFFEPGEPLHPSVWHGVSDAVRAVLEELAVEVV